MPDARVNNTFRRKLKPRFSEKLNLKTKITLAEKENALIDSETSLEAEKAISDDRGIMTFFS